jgi:DUF1680 family protein
MNKIAQVVIVLLLIELISSMKNPERNNDLNIYNYEILKAGAIQPKGWIKEQLKRDLQEGYIGRYDEINSTVTHDVFIHQNRKSRRRFGLRKEWWSGEHEGYWKDAVIRMAFLTGNKEYVEKSQHWIKALEEITKNGDYIGIYADGEKSGYRFNHKRGNGELWTTSRILMAMLAYYEFTNNKEVLDMTEDAVQLIMKNYKDDNYFAVKERGGGVSHGVGFFENLEWLYRITGKKEYLDFSVKLYQDFNKGKMRDDDLTTLELLDENNLFEGHGAHIAEGLFVPEYISSIEESDRYEQAADHVMLKLNQHLTPGGAMRADEWIKQRQGTADERYEYCGIAEMVSPLNKMISFTGDMELADKIEIMTFNAGQGARFPVLSALSYLTSDNRIHIKHSEIIKREHYDASHLAAACCVLNGARLMPYYVEGMWMKKTDDNGIAAVLLGPSELKTTVNDVPVEIIENTNYPFSDEIEFKITALKPVTFPLFIRKPHGCTSVQVNSSSEAKVRETESLVRVEKAWHKNEVIHITFNFDIEKISQPASKTVKDSGVYFKRGPLVFALPFQDKKKTIKEYRNSGFYRYKIKATDSIGWHYKVNTNDEFTYEPSSPEKQLHPWDEPVVKLKGTLRDKQNKKQDVELVPMGNTIFRRVTFSVSHK